VEREREREREEEMYRMRIERNHLILIRDLERLIKVSKQSLIYLYAAFYSWRE